MKRQVGKVPQAPPPPVPTDILSLAADIVGDMKDGIKKGPLDLAETGLRRLAGERRR